MYWVGIEAYVQIENDFLCKNKTVQCIWIYAKSSNGIIYIHFKELTYS